MNDSQVVKELNRQSRTISMLLTIYGKLHNRYQIRARFIDIVVLLASILLCLTTFVDPKILQFLQITLEKSEMILGTTSLFVFAIAIISFMIDWKEKAASFSQAADILNILQAECHEILKLDIHEDSFDLGAKCIKYSSIINHLPKIPERDFQKLKAYHKRRTELDKMIDLYPGSSIRLLKVFTYWRANLHVFLRKPINSSPVEQNKNS